MLKNILFLLFSLLAISHLTAQRQYLEASLTLNDGQILKGKIAAENWINTPRTIEFTSNGGSVKVYGVNDVVRFEAVRQDGENLHFERHICQIETSPIRLKKLDIDPDLEFKTDTSWHQLLYRGTWSLYEMTDPSEKTHYFIKTEDSEVQELVYKTWVRSDPKGTRVDRVELYKKQIMDLAQDCPAVLELLNKGKTLKGNALALDRKGLEAVFKAYDTCQGKNLIYKAKDEAGLWSGKAMIGWHVGSISLYPDVKIYLTNVQSAHVGLSVEYFTPKSNRRVSLFNELSVQHDVRKDSIIFDEFFRREGFIEYKALSIVLHTMGSYRISNAGFAPTIKLGFINRLYLQHSVKYNEYYVFGNYNRYFDYSNFRGYEVGPAIGFSGELNRIGFEIRYSISNLLYWRDLGKKANSRFLSLNATYRLW